MASWRWMMFSGTLLELELERVPQLVRREPPLDEIVAVMRHASDDRHGWRVRALIVVLSRASLRIQEALALGEHDLDHRRGSILIRNGKGGRRREVGMDEWPRRVEH